MSTMYGYEVRQADDVYVDLAEKALGALENDAMTQGTIVMTILPFLCHIPTWMPGAGFKRFALESAETLQRMREDPFQFVKKNLENGFGNPCMVSDLLKSSDDPDEEVIKNVAGVAYAAAADTATSSLLSFTAAMALHPAVVKKCQVEIDLIVGNQRLPIFEDRQSLPYVEAVYREVMRWRPAIPLSLPHAVIDDDVYEGYFIPKGATVVANIWAMTRDPTRYPDPELFKPERFLDAEGNICDDTILAYGFGRRICPGRYMGDATVWAFIARSLAVFDFALAKDASGNPIPIDVDDYTDNLISLPKPFKCSITPRSEAAIHLISSSE
ncbi:hypothetical protein HGRIS_003136 [Hohenbuehelia grisea]|uniref:Cytochrome P450 n=1 Tax=Hohenbuehelia grisea TaxID=104357 RepID=A0ABR3JNB3_9AGAR